MTFRVMGRSWPLGRGLDRAGADALAAVTGGTVEQEGRRYFREERALSRWTGYNPFDGRGNFDGEYVVHAYSIITTDTVIFDVLEALDGHSSQFTSEEFGKLGTVRSRPLPAEIAALPIGDARTAACKARWAAHDVLCEELIRAAFPEVEFTAFSGGHGSASLDAVNAAVTR